LTQKKQKSQDWLPAGDPSFFPARENIALKIVCQDPPLFLNEAGSVFVVQRGLFDHSYELKRL